MRYFVFLLCFFISNQIFSQESGLVNKVLKTKNLIALWDFSEEQGKNRISLKGNYALSETNGGVERVNQGPLSGFSAKFGGGAYLSLSNQKTYDQLS
jgi:hypothetical protein